MTFQTNFSFKGKKNFAIRKKTGVYNIYLNVLWKWIRRSRVSWEGEIVDRLITLVFHEWLHFYITTNCIKDDINLNWNWSEEDFTRASERTLYLYLRLGE